ncbi:MAG: hypothetical protein ACP5RP_00630 [Candidatus Micrarchaeia archaeon]
MADMWSDTTDMIINDFDKTQNDNIALADLFSNPKDFINNKDIATIISKKKEAINNYIDSIINTMQNQKEELYNSAAKCDQLSKQILSKIKDKAAQKWIPVIVPTYVAQNSNGSETIYIDQIDENMDMLIDKFIGGSTYIADMSANFEDYVIGMWLFSGSKNYILSVHFDTNEFYNILNSKNEINDLFDGVSAYIEDNSQTA